MSSRSYATPIYPAGTPTLAPAAAQTPAANAAAVCTLTGEAGNAWKVENVRWSYSGTPTAGSLTIAWTDPTAGAVNEVYYVAGGGPGSFTLNKRFAAGSTVTFTLAAGGSGISGSVYVDAELPTA